MASAPFPSFDFDPSSIKDKLSGRTKWIVLALILVPIFVLLWLARGIFTDYLWYSKMGFEDVFITILLTKTILFFVGFAFVLALVLANLFFVNRKTAGPLDAPLPENMVGIIKKLLVIVCVLVSLILAVILGSVVASKWELFLRFSNAAGFGVKDPLHGNDISFYVFELPIYAFLQGWLLVCVVITMLATTALAFLNFTLRGTAFTLTTPLRNHLLVLGSLAILVLSAGYWIDWFC